MRFFVLGIEKGAFLDDSLIFNEDWLSREARNNRSVNMITGRLVNKDKQCKKCGFYQFVKNGTYQTISQLPEVERRPTYLKLHRARYLCRNCGSTFSASTSLVDDYSQISKQLKYQIAFDLAGMSFICADATSKKIIDILPDKGLHKLVSYFMKYSRKSRLKVRFLVMDMNASYGQLLKTVFPNAIIKRKESGIED
ncbi:hypothetical protein BW731_06505 [Vagococcus martis]|uniref:Transposase IS204/IS1001/IS1096/IS1165 DDE domain-containing protein n=1 Tax=Vagococcus martis TaxID=1768210 RepID=A0A1V4DHB1_9ENTE|nr:transposase [Vagococcus martis]OPF87842.1 hypothetical protein BW731_06505 [Vagococcus martis]